MRLAALLAALIFPLAGEVQSDDSALDRDCNDEYGRDLCDPEVLATIRGYFGAAESAEQLAARGVEGVRVFTISGQAEDMPLVSILREPGAAPRLEVRSITATGPGVLAETIDDKVWSAAAELTASTKSSPVVALKAEEVIEEGVINICSHPWRVVVEAMQAGQVTTRIRQACNEDAVFTQAFELSAIAVPLFPHCERLDAERYRNAFQRLDSCAILAGEDRTAAAEILNALEELNGLDEAPADALAIFTRDAVLAQADVPSVVGAEGVASSWFAIAGPWRSYLNPYSVTSDSVRGEVSGRISRYLNPGMQVADFNQYWVRGEDGAWRISRWTVGAYKDRR